jgi:hypothetical protein
MMGYTDDSNTDRIIAFGLALAFAKSRQANGLYTKRLEYEKEPNTKVEHQPYRQIFRSLGNMYPEQSRGAFKNLGRKRR